MTIKHPFHFLMILSFLVISLYMINDVNCFTLDKESIHNHIDINSFILNEDENLTSYLIDKYPAGDQIWNAKIGGWIDSSPAIGTDGTIYVGSNNTYFYAIENDGVVKWSYKTGDIILSSPALDEANSSVYFGSPDGKLYALDLDGNIKWLYQTDGPIYCSPNLDSSGNIYFGSNDHKLYALDKNGNLLWIYETGGWIDTKPEISENGDIYFASYDGNLYSLASDGNLNWSYNTESWFSFSLTLGNDGVIYAGSYDYNLYAINSDGSLLWTFETFSNRSQVARSGEIFSSPLVTEDGIYFGSNDNCLYKLDKSGNMEWRFITGIAYYDGSAVGTTPALGSDGSIIFGSRDKSLYAVDSSGDLLWSFETGGSIYSSPVVDSLGNIYFGSADGNLYKLGETANLLNTFSLPEIVDTGKYFTPIEEFLLNESVSLYPDLIADYSHSPIPDSFTGNGPEVLDEALKIMHLTRANLDQFEYASNNFTWQLDSVTLSLDDPVAGAEYSKDVSDSIADATDLNELVIIAADANDFSIDPVDFVKELADKPLETAIKDIFTSNGETINTNQETDLLNQLENVPLDIQKGTALILYAMDDSLKMINEAFSTLTPANISLIRNADLIVYVMNHYGSTLRAVLQVLDKIDKQKLYGAGLNLLSAISKAEDYFEKAASIPGDEYLLNFGTPIGNIIIGGAGQNNYIDDSENPSIYDRTTLLIDTGGNDIYDFPAGASNPNNPVCICLDLEGNDEYHPVSNFSQGTGLLGTGILIDYNGSDLYMGSELFEGGSTFSYMQGSAYFGLGVLNDRGQDNDVYVGDYITQGAATIGGLAILQDDGGDDKYYCREYSQAFGYIKGVGIIRDVSGNDLFASGGSDIDFREESPGAERYVCMSQGFGFGARRDMVDNISLSGGIGILVDIEGNDLYSGDYFAQGSSYWYAIGILNDRGGNDLYYARRYSQGTGTHVSVGYMIDDAGDDFYQSWIVSQGHGLDSSVGVLIDLTGNDIYSMKGWYGQGAGGGGLGILVDNAGNDIYYAKDSGGQGFGEPYMSNVYTPIGILIDVGGFDLYSQCYNNQRRTKYTGGITIDVPSGKSGFLSDR